MVDRLDRNPYNLSEILIWQINRITFSAVENESIENCVLDKTKGISLHCLVRSCRLRILPPPPPVTQFLLPPY